MATKKSKIPTLSGGTDFSRALHDWEADHPRAWDDATDAAKGKPKTAGGALADELRTKLGVKDPTARKKERPRVTVAAPPAPAAPTTPTRRQLTADELMREAFEAAGHQKHDPTAKFSGRGYTKALDVDVIDELSAGVVDEARERLGDYDGHTPDDVEFLDLMATADVEPLDRRLDRLRTALDARTKWQSEDPVVPVAPELPEDLTVLTGAQRDLLRRARKQPLIPTLNIRLQRYADAMNELAAFVLQHRQQKTRFVRVITGKGKQSDGPAVLKPAVISWALALPGSGHVLAYAPETDRTGDFGMVIFELRR